MKSRQSFLMLSAFSVFTLLATACGKNTIIKSADVKSFQKDGHVYVEGITDLNMGNISLGSLELPIFNPKNPALEYGTIALKSALDGSPEIDLTVDVTAVTHDQVEDYRLLPNGTGIPVGGLDHVAVAGLQAGNLSRVYLAAGSGVAMIGAALVIPQLDSYTSSLPSVNYFPSFTIGKVKGVAGIFTSPQKEQSGIAVFLDASGAFGVVAANGLEARGFTTQLKFDDQLPPQKIRNKLDRKIYQLHRKRARLQVE